MQSRGSAPPRLLRARDSYLLIHSSQGYGLRLKRNVTLLAVYALGLVMGAIVTLALQAPQTMQRPQEPTWDSIASCVWTRWDSGADMAPVVRFCYRWSARGEYR